MQEQVHEVDFKHLFLPFTNAKAILWIIVIGLIVYFNSLFNGFVGDDFLHIVNNQQIHSFSNIPNLFFQGTFPNEQIVTYYRPLVSSFYALIYLLVGESPFVYHFIQLIFHIGNAIGIFLLFRYLFNKHAAFILAILFLLHPINTESVVYISNLQEVLFLFFGLLAVNVALYKRDTLYSYIVITTLLLLSLLSKETGIVFLVILPILNFLYQRKSFIKSIFQSIAPLSVYLILRIGLAHIYFSHTGNISPIQKLTLTERLLNSPAIILFYLKTFVFPINLIEYQQWVTKSTPFLEFYVPLILDIAVSMLLIFSGIFIYRRHNKYFRDFLFFAFWLLIGMAINLQLFPLDMTVADRWFYFPIIGVFGLLYVVIKNYLSNENSKAWLMFFLIILLVFYFIRVEVRIPNWQSDYKLITHDAQLNKDSPVIEMDLGAFAFSQKNFRESQYHYVRATDLFPSPITYAKLGAYFVNINQPKEAADVFIKAIALDKNNPTLWSNLALARYQTGDKKGALEAAKRAYDISPTSNNSTILKVIQNGKPIQVN